MLKRLVCVLLWLASSHAMAQLPNDVVSSLKVPPVPNRLYVGDVAINHIADGRVHLLDGDTGKYLGLIGAGFAGQFTLSPDRRTLYVATTYLSRLQRGTRTDVIEVYDTDTLSLRHEILVDDKRAQSLGYRGYLRTSSDGRLMYLQNATPATSVTVVDLELRRMVGEIEIPGCWAIFPSATHPRRFSTMCGDGTLSTFTLRDDGTLPAEGGRTNSETFFDPDADALFIHGEQDGDVYRFVSFRGDLVVFDLSGPVARLVERWSLIDAAGARKGGWRPGGYQPIAYHAPTKRLHVGVHPKGVEGSHKLPAQEIWVFDTVTRKRVGRLPGDNAIAMTLAETAQPQLYVIDGVKNGVLMRRAGERRARWNEAPVGDASIRLEVR